MRIFINIMVISVFFILYLQIRQDWPAVANTRPEFTMVPFAITLALILLILNKVILSKDKMEKKDTKNAG